MCSWRIFLIGSILLTSSIWLAGQAGRSFDRAKWEDMTREVDYIEQQEKAEEESSDAEAANNGESELVRPRGPSTFSSTWSTVIKVLAILVLMILLAFLVKIIIDANSGVRSRKVKKTSFDFDEAEELEDNLMEADLDPYLQDALAKEQYLWAIRLYYLQILQSLGERRFIQWKKDKTNREYLVEIKGPLQNTFQHLTHTFDWLWYGSVKLDKAEFEATAPAFERFLKSIRAEKVKSPDIP